MTKKSVPGEDTLPKKRSVISVTAATPLSVHTKGFNLAVKRILLIEDHVVFRQALAFLIDRQPGLQVVAQAGSLQEGISKASEGFDVAVVDLSMPDGDGADLVGRLREIAPHAGVLGLSRRRKPERYARVLEAGANDVVSKGATIEEMLGALESLRKFSESSGVASRPLCRAIRGDEQPPGERAAPEPPLTPWSLLPPASEN